MSPQSLPKPPELEFALLCARSSWDQAGEQRFADLAPQIDWQRLLQEAAWHGLVPLVYRRLRQHSQTTCPPATLEELRALSIGTAIQNNHLWRQLIRLTERLEAAQIPVIPLKGLVLARTVWGSLEFRPSCDLDLLVRPEDVERAITQVYELGFEPNDDPVAGWLPEQIRIEYEQQFWSETTQTGLDLHWRLHLPGYRIAPNDAQIWERSRFGELDGQPFRTLEFADNLMFLVMHAAKHEWAAARWLVDIAQLLRPGDVDWDALSRRSREWSMRRMWHTTLQVCATWLQLDFPAAVAADVRADAGAQRLATEVGKRWRQPASTEEPAAPFPWRSLYFQAFDAHADRARMLVDFWAKPGPHDWQFCPLPRPLWPLYAAVRPLRAFTHEGGAAVKKYFGRARSP